MHVVDIDLLAMAKKHWPGVILRAQEAVVAVTPNSNLHRFDVVTASGELEYADGVHILVDGSGGAEVHVYPDTVQKRVIREHCADYARR